MIAAGQLAGGGEVLVRITDHAVQRYRERVKLGLAHTEARDELIRLIRLCPIREGVPAWLDAQQHSLFHVDLGTVMIAVDPDPRHAEHLVALTVLTTGCFARSRRSRNARHSRSRRRRAVRPASSLPSLDR